MTCLLYTSAKRLGLCQKSMFVVPNHLTLQWANEFLRLYPSAKLLVASKKDFETARRKKFCARIATGDYDAVIIGHSQFEKIPVSAERQERILTAQIDEIENAIAEMKSQNGERFSIKQMEKTLSLIHICSYEDRFKIPDGSAVEIEYPNRKFSARCEYMDEYHLRLGYDVLHICQLAEMLERGGGTCRPEPVSYTHLALPSSKNWCRKALSSVGVIRKRNTFALRTREMRW